MRSLPYFGPRGFVLCNILLLPLVHAAAATGSSADGLVGSAASPTQSPSFADRLRQKVSDVRAGATGMVAVVGDAARQITHHDTTFSNVVPQERGPAQAGVVEDYAAAKPARLDTGEHDELAAQLDLVEGTEELPRLSTVSDVSTGAGSFGASSSSRPTFKSTSSLSPLSPPAEADAAAVEALEHDLLFREVHHVDLTKKKPRGLSEEDVENLGNKKGTAEDGRVLSIADRSTATSMTMPFLDVEGPLLLSPRQNSSSPTVPTIPGTVGEELNALAGLGTTVGEELDALAGIDIPAVLPIESTLISRGQFPELRSPTLTMTQLPRQRRPIPRSRYPSASALEKQCVEVKSMVGKKKNLGLCRSMCFFTQHPAQHYPWRALPFGTSHLLKMKNVWSMTVVVALF